MSDSQLVIPKFIHIIQILFGSFSILGSFIIFLSYIFIKKFRQFPNHFLVFNALSDISFTSYLMIAPHVI